MSGGGKGGSTTSTVEVPAFLENAARSNLAKADTLSRIGYTPYYGPDVAAMTPSQMAAIQGTNTAALSFGLPSVADPTAGMSQPLSFGGVPAYSSGGIYDQALAELQRRQPSQYNALRAPFIDPVTGAQPAAPFGFGGTGPGVLDMGMAAPSPVVAPVVRDGGGGSGSMSSGMSAAPAGGGRSTTSMATPASFLPGGVNTNNPSSVVNRVAASLAPPQAPPTAANKPVARPSVVASQPTAPSAAATKAAADKAAAERAAADKAAASKAAADKAAAERAARDKIAAAEKAAADKAAATKAAADKAAATKAAAEKAAATKAAAEKAAATKAAASKVAASKAAPSKAAPSKSAPSKSTTSSGGRR